MNLPDVPRVIYNKTSLTEVICQFRFPPILKISVGVPAAFQEIVRSEFPSYELRQESGQIPIPEEFRDAIMPQLPKKFNFINKQKTTRITLTEKFLALSTTSYGRFEEFRTNMNLALKALNKVYKPSFYDRVGLRYIDIIKRKELNILDSKWHELLKSQFAGELSGALSDDIQGIETNSLYTFEWGKLHCRHGLIELENQEECYFIDNDFYKDNETIEYSEIKSIIGEFNALEKRFLRSCISDKLHAAMEPVDP